MLNYNVQNMRKGTAQLWDMEVIQYLILEKISILRISLNYEELIFTSFILRHLGLRLQCFQCRPDIKISLLSMISSLLDASHCAEESEYLVNLSHFKSTNLWHFKLLELLLCLGARVSAADLVFFDSFFLLN